MTLYTRFVAHIDAALDALTANGGLPSGLARAAVTVEPPRDASHGDLATNAAMVLAKPANTNPRALAEKIAAELAKLDEVASVSVAGPGFMEVMSRNSAGIINSLAFVAVAFLVVWLGVRPMVRSFSGGSAATAELGQEAAGLELPDFSPGLGGASAGGGLMDGFGADFGFDSTDDLLSGDNGDGDFNRRVREGPERRLSRMVEISEERAAKILRKWAIEKAA
jgi:hypothetical protein